MCCKISINSEVSSRVINFHWYFPMLYVLHVLLESLSLTKFDNVYAFYHILSICKRESPGTAEFQKANDGQLTA